jgi:DNA-binding NarL/FixJ family response regulator
VTHRVLIVDDSKLARMAMARALNSLHPDWVTVEASNADEAMLRVKEVAPDFVLLDFNMPGLTGIDLAAQLKALNPRIGIAVISANHQVEVVKRAQEAGATFLPKPLAEKALGEFLDAAVRQRKASAQ